MILEAVSSFETSVALKNKVVTHESRTHYPFHTSVLCSKTAGTADSSGNDPVQVHVTSSNLQTRRLLKKKQFRRFNGLPEGSNLLLRSPLSI
jgi:hypothetical protein